MQESTRLHRSHSYPYHSISENVDRERFIETESGSYTIIVDEVGNFTLTLPGGKKVVDNLNEYIDRSHLYALLDQKVFDFLQETAKFMETEYIKENPAEERVVMTMNNTEKYILSVNKQTGASKLEYPVRVREFNIVDIFLVNPGLPLYFEGKLIIYFRDMLKKKGVSIPRIPYFPGVKISGPLESE